MKFTVVLFIFSVFYPSLALDDLPIYLDAGCPATGLPKSYASGPSTMEIAKLTEGNTIPVTCTEAFRGSDAAVIHNTRNLGNGEYFDFIFKWADDRNHSVIKYQDLRMWIKNKNSTIAKFRVSWDALNYATAKSKAIEVPAGQDWKEYVVPLSDLGSDTVWGLKFSNPANQYGGADTSVPPINILVDSITITDGTNNGSLSIPATVFNSRPASWPSTFLVGSFDNRDINKSSIAAQGGGKYRYQYIMPDILTQYSPSGKGYVYDYAMESQTLGVKTGIVWYNLGKSGEGYDAVSKNLQDTSYMKSYFDRYEGVLEQLKQAGQSDYIIVLEPDMYGFIMRGDKFHPADVSVNMDRANEITRKSYPATMVGWGQYMVQRAKEVLNKGVIVGHMPNHWGVNIPGQVGMGRKEAHIISGLVIGQFIKEMGAYGMGDVVFVEKTDHDAGGKPSNENWFWDSTGYGKFFLWTKAIAWRTGLPVVGWQIAEGNMNHPLSTDRDNAVETFLAHPQWWVDGGFIGILFGAGNPGCANYQTDNDNGWFVEHMTTYNANPYPLPATNALLPGNRAANVPNGKLRITAAINGIRLSGWSGIADIRMYSVSGQMLTSAHMLSGEHLSLTSLHPGLYIVNVKSIDIVKTLPVTVSGGFARSKRNR